MTSVIRFGWSSVAQAQRGAPDSTGLMAVVVQGKSERPLVLMMDLQHYNDGASLTNVAAHAVQYVMKAAGLPSATDWVELDSMGFLDVMEPRIGVSYVVEFKPLRADNVAPRSLEAFLAAYGAAGRSAWLALDAALEREGIEVAMIDGTDEHEVPARAVVVFSGLISNGTAVWA